MGVDRQMPILIADRNQSAVFVIRRQLAALGLMCVDEASEGAAALSKLRTQTYELVIADSTLREANPSELWHGAKPKPLQPAPAFIVTRPRDITAILINMPSQAAAVHLTKPFTTTDLRIAIDRLCRPSHLAA